MKKFRDYLTEEFNQNEYKPAALKWLNNRFGSENEFIHKPNLTDSGGNKYFDVSIDGKTFTIVGRKHESETENPKNTIIFKITPDEDEEVKDDKEF
jgi:hypothetical protein